MGMDSRFVASREDLYNVQMEVKQLQATQHNTTERLLRVERRLAEDAAVKSVWATSPFPSALSGTPQHGPLQIPPGDVFDEFDEHGQNLLGSLHLDAEDEPIRRGAASRANSVRFDESALHGANWGQGARQAGDFAPIRPSSGFGMMERSLSHKSDGRHSSAGHSVHSVHSIASGRGSSLGLDTHFMGVGREDDSPQDIPAPPPGLLVLGSVPAIVRCWLSENFAHNTLLYADVCSGAQRSTLEYSLVKELGLEQDIQKGADGVSRLTVTVYLAEAIVAQSNSTRSPAPGPNIPCMTVNFELTGIEQAETREAGKAIRIFIGTDALRAHSADLLFSQNLMTLYSRDRDKLSVPFVRPEDDSLFRFLATTNLVPEKPKLNASAPEFILNNIKPPPPAGAQHTGLQTPTEKENKGENGSPGLPHYQDSNFGPSSEHSESGGESERASMDKANNNTEHSGSEKEVPVSSTESARRDSTGIWGSWRNSTTNGGGGGGGGGEHSQRSENGLSGYQPAGRSRMKVLKPSKSLNSSSTRPGAPFESPAATRSINEHRRKSHAGVESAPASATSATGSTVRWEKRSVSGTVSSSMGMAVKEPKVQSATLDNRNPPSILPRSVNPVGGASAFSWMTPTSKTPKTPTFAD
ncbi:hypothetical protein GGTG_08159 [Gaeumannomyces tritici R3-111a-1]|uniref:Ubiquitin carboxyl-terminal hydrolase 19 n=1 Tax=Gaeumannomyces tritici (strain R3-111a-1) TaxID=644352 RepID=J3P3S4_GAET3|nr:hypothetical protein GGTG_08159 [Gaeumannomyces tritici R3-111a-1]EJT74318.1 hypothetical protein GGTG_08159 [Gaeumannomyces tritici R3-111a-1]